MIPLNRSRKVIFPPFSSRQTIWQSRSSFLLKTLCTSHRIHNSIIYEYPGVQEIMNNAKYKYCLSQIQVLHKRRIAVRCDTCSNQCLSLLIFPRYNANLELIGQFKWQHELLIVKCSKVWDIFTRRGHIWEITEFVHNLEQEPKFQVGSSLL